jgi:hypothetical protein
MGFEIPASFFEDIGQTEPVRNTYGSEGRNWTPAGAMKWYDGIIDDILAHPGTSLTETAHRLGRAPDTVQCIARSDMFRARWAQRRQQFEDALRDRLVAKITRTAELALDSTIEVLEKKRDTIPLPMLTEITKSTLDRLGYGPSRSESPSVQVSVNNNVVSAEALAAAREKLKLVEGNGVPVAPVAGPEPQAGEED